MSVIQFVLEGSFVFLCEKNLIKGLRKSQKGKDGFAENECGGIKLWVLFIHSPRSGSACWTRGPRERGAGFAQNPDGRLSRTSSGDPKVPTRQVQERTKDRGIEFTGRGQMTGLQCPQKRQDCSRIWEHGLPWGTLHMALPRAGSERPRWGRARRAADTAHGRHVTLTYPRYPGALRRDSSLMAAAIKVRR